MRVHGIWCGDASAQTANTKKKYKKKCEKENLMKIILIGEYIQWRDRENWEVRETYEECMKQDITLRKIDTIKRLTNTGKHQTGIETDSETDSGRKRAKSIKSI